MVKRQSESDLLYVLAIITVLVACAGMTEALCSDWLAVWKALLFGVLVLVSFLVARGIYAMNTGTLSRAYEASEEPYVQREPCPGISRKEAFAANVVTMAHPLAEPHDFQSLPLFETERIIRGGKYSLELIKSSNGDPVLVVCED